MMMTANRPLVGTGVAIIDDDEILLIKRAHDPGKDKWAIPGGKVEYGESLAEAATREVKEETGLLVELDEIIWVGESMSPDHHIVLIDFAGRAVGGTLMAGDDASEVAWVRIQDAYEMNLTPTMYDLLDVLTEMQEDG
jgi:mutator protein MutT